MKCPRCHQTHCICLHPPAEYLAPGLDRQARCMKCLQYEPMRNCSRIENAMTVWLCNPCQKELTKLVLYWLPRSSRPAVPAFYLPPETST